MITGIVRILQANSKALTSPVFVHWCWKWYFTR